jgi:hypothetical protein
MSEICATRKTNPSGAARTLMAAVSLLALVTFPNATFGEELRIGDFQILLPDGYVHLPKQSKTDADHWQNKNGIGVTIDVLSHKPMSVDQEKSAIEKWRNYGRTEMVAVAARHGEVTMSTREEALASGTVLMSVADQQHASGKVRFGLFFLLIGPDARLAQIVVEGPGVASDRFREFRPVVDSARWTN